MSDVEKATRFPRQKRSRDTVDAILEAAVQVLERRGERGFNTNAVAERAGVSIGTIYRYFPDKSAILIALARREMDAVSIAMSAKVGAGLAPDRAAIRAFLQAFGGRTTARRAAVAALLARTDPAELASGHGRLDGAFVDAEGRALSPIAYFVLSRAVHGAMRAAVMEGADFLLSQAFEDELVRLGRAYLGYPTRR